MITSPEFLKRFALMLDENQQNKLFSARILIFGVGGVGGTLTHCLVRSGISNIGIVDFDTVDITNINRQLVANVKNVGKFKVDEMESQLKDINPNAKIKKYNLKLSADTINQIDFENYDYVVDCIDDLPAKKLLISRTNQAKIPFLCACGAGNRYSEIPQFEIADISKTSYDPIAKILRKFCAAERIKKLNVCYTKQKAGKFDCKTVGSVVYYPMNMATVMCAKIVNDIIGG